MWHTDALEMLGILTDLGFKDERMQNAVDLVVKRQDGRGRWKLSATHNGSFVIDIERKGVQSRWITLNALLVLKRYYG